LQEPTNESDILVIVIKFVLVVVDTLQRLQVDLVSQQAPNPTKSLDELGTLLGSVRDKLEIRPKVLVFIRKPFQQGSRFLRVFHFLARGFVRELLPILLLILVRVYDDLLSSCIPKYMSSDVQIFPNDQRLDGAEFESLQRVLNPKTVFARVLADLVEVLLDQLLFLNELDVCERFCSEFDRLV